MPAGIILDISVEESMARLRAVLDPVNTGQIASAQKKLFEYLSFLLSQFGKGNKKNPIVDVLDHVGNYWRSGLLLILQTGPYRPVTISKLFEALNPLHPISRRMLSLNLRLLERDGLIKRHVVRDEWNHIEYSITPLGDQLANHVMSIMKWTADHANEIIDARTLSDAADEPSWS